MNKKMQIRLISILILITSSLYSQTRCLLHLEDGKLKGHCENTYIIKAFEIEIMGTELDSATLFNQLPLNGRFTVTKKCTMLDMYQRKVKDLVMLVMC